jgi:hypothetical protein
MKRRLFAIVAPVSLLLCIGVLAMWLRSEHRSDMWSRQSGDAVDMVWSNKSRIGFGRLTDAPFRFEEPWHWTFVPAETPPPRQPGFFGAMGFGSIDRLQVFFPKTIAPRLTPFQVRQRDWWMPYWFIEFVLVLLPLMWALRWYKERHRHKPGFCSTCGYNLTGNVSGICPECGTPIPPDLARKPVT